MLDKRLERQENHHRFLKFSDRAILTSIIIVELARLEETMIKVDAHDQALIDIAVKAMQNAIGEAHSRPAVAKRLATAAMRHRNRGRTAAIKRHPFSGSCEASGFPLHKHDAVLDELEPEKGYEGRVRWVCPKTNNSGKKSCGGC